MTSITATKEAYLELAFTNSKDSQVMKHLETSAQAPLQSYFTGNFVRKSSPCHQVPHTQRKIYVTSKLSFWNPDFNILQIVTLIQLKLLSKAQPLTISYFSWHIFK